MEVKFTVPEPLIWLVNRFLEPSTWRGLCYLGIGAGAQLEPEHIEAIITAGMGVAGLINVFRREHE